MSYLESFIKYFNSLYQNTKYISVEVILDPRYEKIPEYFNIKGKDRYEVENMHNFHKWLSNLPFSSYTEKQIIIFEQAVNKTIIKELVFVDGIQDKNQKRVYKKNIIHSSVILEKKSFPTIVIKSFLEEKIDEDIFTPEHIFLSRQFYTQMNDWKMCIEFNKIVESRDINIIKDAKTRFFAIADISNPKFYSTTDLIVIKFIMNDNITMRHLSDIYKYLELTLPKKSQEDQFMNELNALFPMGNRKFSHTIKSMLPPCIEMNKRIYFIDVLSNSKDFYITDKADGKRVLLYVAENIVGYFDNSFHHINTPFGRDFSILECEKIEEEFYAFDIILYKGKNITSSYFLERHTFLHTLSNIAGLHIKEFYPFDTKTITSLYEKYKALKYHIDGIIFTPINKPYKLTKSFKWKPIDETSIDFLVKKCPRELLGKYPYVYKEGYILYILFVGITKRDFMTFNMKKIQFYDRIFSCTNPHYFPIQFSPSDFPDVHIYYSEDNTLDDKIVELKYSGKWVFSRIRTDREQDKKQEYYGNNFRVAENIWRNYSNPITVQYLSTDRKELENEFYFIKEHSDIYKNLREFNNSVKYSLINKYVRPNSWVIDLCSGKGQDIFKYNNANVANVLFIDNNTNNLSEIVSRKYKLADNSANRNQMGVYIISTDLNNEYTKNLQIIKDRGIPLNKKQVSLIVCNFGIHYLVGSENAMDNILSFVDNLLPCGSRFMFTCLDGARVFKLLKKDKEWGDGKKYHIRKLYTTTKFTGVNQEVEILLPFTDGKYYREPLVNLAMIKKNMRERKISCEECNTFDIFQDQDNLDYLDKNYLQLITFCVFYKNNYRH